MSIFGKLAGSVLRTAALPLTVAADVVLLPVRGPEDEHPFKSTKAQLSKVRENAEAIIEEIES